MVLAALSGGELIIVAMAVFALGCMVSASVLGIFTRLTRGRLSRSERAHTPSQSSSGRSSSGQRTSGRSD